MIHSRQLKRHLTRVQARSNLQARNPMPHHSYHCYNMQYEVEYFLEASLIGRCGSGVSNRTLSPAPELRIPLHR